MHIEFMSVPTEYTKETLRAPEFLFLPKMGILGSQASMIKKSNYGLWATFELVFSTFHGAKKPLLFCKNIVVLMALKT